jgi:hypothetical protein
VLVQGRIVASRKGETEGETMDKDSFKERERAQEEGYFRAQDAKLLEKLREDARLEEIVLALAEQLQLNNPELLRRVIATSHSTRGGFLLAPLVQAAWAEERHRSGATRPRLAAAAASRPLRRMRSSSSGPRAAGE